MISESRKAPINIFTTNYDLYNEQALDFWDFHIIMDLQEHIKENLTQQVISMPM